MKRRERKKNRSMLDLRERTSQPTTSVFSNYYDFVLTGYNIFSLTIHLNNDFVFTSIRLTIFLLCTS